MLCSEEKTDEDVFEPEVLSVEFGVEFKDEPLLKCVRVLAST